MREGRVTFKYRKSGNGHVLHGMDMKTKKKDQEQKGNHSWRAGKDRCAFGRVSVQETLYTHFHPGHVISSLACGSHISILVNSAVKHSAFWQKTIHLHLPLSTMPWAGRSIDNWCEMFAKKVWWICNTPVLSQGRPLRRWMPDIRAHWEESPLQCKTKWDPAAIMCADTPAFAISCSSSNVPLKTVME